MRKIRREVTRKNPEDFRTKDYADATVLESGRRGDLDFDWRPTYMPYNCQRICNSAVAPCRIFLNGYVRSATTKSRSSFPMCRT